jgi:hypothetical protein
MLWLFPFLLLAGVLLFAIRGNSFGLIAAVLIGLVALAVAVLRDTGRRCMYTLRGDTLLLKAGDRSVSYSIPEVIDVTLMDRIAARTHVRSLLDKVEDRATRDRMMEEILRYCAVDIGMVSYTMGIGTEIIDRLPASRSNLVLVRLRQGRVHLLSPRYDQDLAETIVRLLREGPSP